MGCRKKLHQKPRKEHQRPTAHHLVIGAAAPEYPVVSATGIFIPYMNLEKLLVEYYEYCKVMQLATVRDGQPWLCSVYFASDYQLNVYWTSAKKRRHSKELIAHPACAVTIVKDTERKQALQMTGMAYEVENDDLDRVNTLYGSKFGDKPERLAEIRAGNPEGRAYWVFKPTSISLWDEVNFPDSPKQEYDLSQLKL